MNQHNIHKIAINGYGRIGQCLLRALYENGYRERLKIVAINDAVDVETLAYLSRYDTTHGRAPYSVEVKDGALIINGDIIQVNSELNPQRLDWQACNIDLLLECSGAFTDRGTAQTHLKNGAPKLLFSQPAKSDVDATIVYGINQHAIPQSATIVSAASCTTNCIIPVLTLLDNALGIESGTLTTIHSAMNDQPMIDRAHSGNLRLARSGLQSIIPVETGLVQGIERILPAMGGKLTASAVRIPTINVSCIDATFVLNNTTSVVQINELLCNAANTNLRSIVGFTDEPHASIDFNHDSRSVIVDGTQTQLAGSRTVRLLCWFDNEWAYANRMLDIAQHWLEQ